MQSNVTYIIIYVNQHSTNINQKKKKQFVYDFIKIYCNYLNSLRKPIALHTFVHP